MGWRCSDGEIQPPRGRERCTVVVSAPMRLVIAVFSLDFQPLDRAAAAATLTLGQRFKLVPTECSCGRSHWSAGVNLARVDRLAPATKAAIRALDEPPALRALVRLVGIRDAAEQISELRRYLFGAESSRRVPLARVA